MHQTVTLPSSIEELIRVAIFPHDLHQKEASRKEIRRRADEKRIIPSPIAPLYKAFADGNVSGFTVPAINLRALPYDMARLIFRLMNEHAIGPVLFEIAHSEMLYTTQTYDDVAICVLAAAIAEGYTGPVFLQADHVQVNAKAYARDADAEIRSLRGLLTEALDAGFYNIDIDASTVVDLTRPNIVDQQRENALITEELTSFLRMHQPKGVELTFGGEIGHIGDRNSTLEDFTTFMDLLTHGDREHMLSKIAIQTGTSHGGTVDSEGHLKTPAPDFELHKEIGAIARETYGMGGTVQHGASTLPVELFDKFPSVGTLEIHLATNFQNIILDSLPDSLQKEINEWVDKSFLKDKNPSDSHEQFIYKQRKRALGQFKKTLWYMSEIEKAPILQNLNSYLARVFAKLHMFDTKNILEKYV